VDSWFATMPAGIEIMIAMEKPNAMTTSSVRIFLLETFLIALVKVPKINHLHIHAALNPKKQDVQVADSGPVWLGLVLMTF
jgi:hypothetical protein